MNFDIQKIRADFPILATHVNGKPLVYLDSGATTQKPLAVIKAIDEFYRSQNSNIHRGVHHLSDLATRKYESARNKVREFINAENLSEIIFTKGATESINLVAFSFGERFVNEGDEIIVSEMEHHANIVSWQLMCERRKAKVVKLPLNEQGELQLDLLPKLINSRTKLIAVTHVSNSLGTVNPIEAIIELAHKHGVKVLIDGSQSIQHKKIDVQKLDCDFFVFSGHKIYASTGIGVLYGKEALLNEMPPYQGGGDMIKTVSFEKTTFNELPFKFEAGTTDYVGAASLETAITYLESIGFEEIQQYETELHQYARKKLEQIPGIKIFGSKTNNAAVISFLLKDIHPYDVGMMLDKMGIAVRTGTHCCQPAMDFYGIDGTIRASFCFYNTTEEADKLYEALLRITRMFE